ncbi:MAG: hypothetical protein ACYCX2_02005 [Christensenellales bacterium]
MSNTTGGANTICPFYRGEGPLRVNCEGPTSRSFLSIVFENKDRKVKWQEEKCMSYQYSERCCIALMIRQRYEEAEKREQKKLEEIREGQKRVFQSRVQILG